MDKHIFSRLRTQLRTHTSSQLYVLQRCLSVSYARAVRHTSSQAGDMSLTLSLLAIIISLVGITIGSAAVRHTQTPTTRADAFPYESILEVRNEQGAVITWQDGMRWETTVAGDTNRGDIKDPDKPEARLTWTTSAVPPAMQNATATVSVTLPGYTITGGFCEDRAGTTCTRARRDGAVWRNITLEKDAKITYGYIVSRTSEDACALRESSCAPRNLKIKDIDRNEVRLEWDYPKPCAGFVRGTDEFWIDVAAPGRIVCSGMQKDDDGSCKLRRDTLRQIDRTSPEYTRESWQENTTYTVKLYAHDTSAACTSSPVEKTFTYTAPTEAPTAQPTREPQPTQPDPQPGQVCTEKGASCQDTYPEACTTASGQTGTRICHKYGICDGPGGGTECLWGAGSYCDPCIAEGGGGGSCGKSCIYSQKEGSQTVCYQGNCLDGSQNCSTNDNCGFVPGCSTGKRVTCPGHTPTPVEEVGTMNIIFRYDKGCDGQSEDDKNKEKQLSDEDKSDYYDKNPPKVHLRYSIRDDDNNLIDYTDTWLNHDYYYDYPLPPKGKTYNLQVHAVSDRYKLCNSDDINTKRFPYTREVFHPTPDGLNIFSGTIFVDLNDTATPQEPQSPEVDECKAEVLEGSGSYRVMIVGDFTEVHGAYEGFKEKAEEAIKGLKESNINELDDNLSKIQFLIKKDPEDFGCLSKKGKYCENKDRADMLKTKCRVDNVMVLTDYYTDGGYGFFDGVAFTFSGESYYVARHEWGHSIARLVDEYVYDDNKARADIDTSANCTLSTDTECNKWRDKDKSLECLKGCSVKDAYRSSNDSIMNKKSWPNTWNKPSLWQWNNILSKYSLTASIDDNQLYHVVYTLTLNQSEENVLNLQSLTAGTGYPVENYADDLKSYYTIDILDTSGSVLHTRKEAKHSMRFGETVDISLKDTLTLYLPYYTTAQTIRIRDEQGQTVFTTPVKNEMYSVPEDTQNLCGNSFCDIANGEDAQSCRADCGPQVGKPESARADLDNNGIVNALDLAILIDAYGTPDADIDGDSKTNAIDYSILLRWIGTEVGEEE